MRELRGRTQASAPRRHDDARALWLLALGVLLLAVLTLAPGSARAQTYTVGSTPYAWIPTAGHAAISTWDNGVGCPSSTGDDSLSASLPIGFTFRYGTSNYTQLRVFTNGRVQFNNTRCSFGTQAVGPPRTYPDPMPANNLTNTIRIYGADLDASSGGGGGTITYATTGTSPNRVFVISWNGVPQWQAPGTSYNLQVQLIEGGEFRFMYGVSQDNYPGSTSIGPAQLGWELTTGDYYATTGLPANGSGLRFFIPPAASLNVTRISNVISDPVNGSTNPKRIPNAVLSYQTTVANLGTAQVDSGSLVIVDPIPPNTDLYVGANPVVTFTDGTPSSGLGLGGSSVTYTRQAGGVGPFTYVPVANAQGFDPLVTAIRIAPSGSMKTGTGSPRPNFTISYRVRVR